MAEEKKEVKTKRPTAIKRDIQNEKKRLINRAFKSQVKTAIRIFEKEVEDKKLDQAKESLNSLYSLLDKAAKRNIFKVNKVSRLKSQFTAKVSG